METVTIKGKSYSYVSNYLDSTQLLKGFNRLARNTFDFELEEWDDPSYIPYSLLDGNLLVANVSVQKISFTHRKKRYNCVQILTVMTDRDYRGRGLSGYLLNRVIKEWEKQTDLIYLFANDEVLDFYPRFGFTKANEYLHCSTTLPNSEKAPTLKLDTEKSEYLRIIREHIQYGFSGASLSTPDAKGLIEWLCLEMYSDKLLYLPALETLAIAKIDNQTLKLHALLSKKKVSLQDVIAILRDEKTERVELGFTPIENEQFQRTYLQTENSTLFIRNENNQWFTGNTLRFPLLTRT